MKIYFLLLFFLLKSLMFSITFTSQEERWISENRDKTIEVNYVYVTFGDVFGYFDKNGKVQGIYQDFFREIEHKTGLKFQVNLISREDVWARMENTDSSIYLKLSKNSEREKTLTFGEIFHSYEIVMIGNSPFEPYFDQNLSGKKIGILPRTSEENHFRENYVYDQYIPVAVSTIDDGFKKLYAGEIDYFLGKTEYLRETDKFIASLSRVDKGNYTFAISKNYPEIFSIVEKEMGLYSENRLVDSIRDHRVKYFRENIREHPDYKAVKENYDVIKVLLSNEGYYMPFYYYSEGEYFGYLPEFYKSIGKILDIPIEFVRKEEVLDSGLKNYHIKAMDINIFTGEWDYHKYYRGKVAIIGKKDSDFILDTQELNKYRIGMKNPTKEIKQRFKKTIGINSYEEAIKDVSKGKMDYLIGDFQILSSLMGNYHLGNKVKIAGYLPYEIYITSSVEEGHEDLKSIMKKIGKPFLGENHVLNDAMKKSTIINPDHSKNFLFVGIILFISIFFWFHVKKMEAEEKKRENMMNSLIESFEMANYYNDEDTGNHIVRINRYAGVLAEKAGCSRSFVKDISKYSSLHDIGKIGIPEIILKKPGKLTDEEMKGMKKHVDIGYTLTRKMNAGVMAENIARYHHEKWDGKGYLWGLAGEKIPLEARIVALVDVYDALRQKRVYKEGFSHKKSLEIISEESGKSFDPYLVNVFIRFNMEFDEIFSNHM